MNPLVVFALACLAVVSAQTNSALKPTVGASGPLGPGGLGAGPLPTPGGTPTLPSNTNSGVGQINPLMLALGGSDNLMRTLMLPSLSRLGSVNQYYFLRGGMDKMAQSLMSDMMSQMLTRSMPGMSPMMAPLLTSQFVDAPDGWTMSNLLLNSMSNNAQGTQGGARSGTGVGNLGGSMGGGLNNLFGSLFGGQTQQPAGQGMPLPQGAAAPNTDAGSTNPFGNMALPLMAAMF